MANDDDDKRGSRDNTGKEHRPKHARNNENAPDGHLGTNRIFATGLNLGGSSKSRHTTQAGEKSQQQTQKPEQATPKKHIDPSKDTRPVFHETGDKEIDKFYQKSHRMIPKDQAAKGVVADRPKVSQNAFAKSFRQARDQAPKVNKPKGPEID